MSQFWGSLHRTALSVATRYLIWEFKVVQQGTLGISSLAPLGERGDRKAGGEGVIGMWNPRIRAAVPASHGINATRAHMIGTPSPPRQAERGAPCPPRLVKAPVAVHAL